MMHRIVVGSVACLLVLAVALVVHADTVKLRDGTSVEGLVVAETADLIMIQVNGKSKKIQRKDIAGIVRGPASTNKVRKGGGNAGSKSLNKLFTQLRKRTTARLKTAPSGWLGAEHANSVADIRSLEEYIASYGLQSGNYAISILKRLSLSELAGHKAFVKSLVTIINTCGRDIVRPAWEDLLLSILKKWQALYAKNARTPEFKNDAPMLAGRHVFQAISGSLEKSYGNNYRGYHYSYDGDRLSSCPVGGKIVRKKMVVPR